MSEEQRLSKAYPKDLTKVVEYLESVSYARKTVDERAKEHFSVLAAYGFPEILLRRQIETSENRLRWNWPPLRS